MFITSIPPAALQLYILQSCANMILFPTLAKHRLQVKGKETSTFSGALMKKGLCRSNRFELFWTFLYLQKSTGKERSLFVHAHLSPKYTLQRESWFSIIVPWCEVETSVLHRKICCYAIHLAWFGAGPWLDRTWAFPCAVVRTYTVNNRCHGICKLGRSAGIAHGAAVETP